MAKKKKGNKSSSAYIVLDRECDTAMADKKGFLPCEGGVKCFTCIACKEQSTTGEWSHHDPLRGVANRVPNLPAW